MVLQGIRHGKVSEKLVLKEGWSLVRVVFHLGICCIWNAGCLQQFKNISECESCAKKCSGQGCAGKSVSRQCGMVVMLLYLCLWMYIVYSSEIWCVMFLSTEFFWSLVCDISVYRNLLQQETKKLRSHPACGEFLLLPTKGGSKTDVRNYLSLLIPLLCNLLQDFT